MHFILNKIISYFHKILGYTLSKLTDRIKSSLRRMIVESKWAFTLFKNKSIWEKEDYNTKWSETRWELLKKWGPISCSIKETHRLRSLHNRYQGKRIFLMGSGPSLNRMPLEYLKDEYTFGVNRIYLLFDRINWRPTFYTVHDWRVGPDCADEINKLNGMTFFLPQNFKGLLKPSSSSYWYWTKPHRENDEFAFDITKGIITGETIMVIAIQIAYYLGFDPIYLIGVDASYVVPPSVKQSGRILHNNTRIFLESTADDDPNHFSPEYFGKGKKWHCPRVSGMIEGFTRCQNAIESKNRKIYNATVGGKLETFKRVDFNTLF